MFVRAKRGIVGCCRFIGKCGSLYGSVTLSKAWFLYDCKDRSATIAMIAMIAAKL